MSRATATSPSAASLVLAGDRPADVVHFEGETVDFFVAAADLLGVPKSVAAVYGLVFASAEPLSFTEIASRLDFSNGSVSQGLRVLKEIGAVKPAPPAADGLERYVPDLELRKLVARFLEHRLGRQLDSGLRRLEALRAAVPAADAAQTKELNRRLKSLEDWHSRARQLLPLARTVLKLG